MNTKNSFQWETIKRFELYRGRVKAIGELMGLEIKDNVMVELKRNLRGAIIEIRELGK